MSASNLERLHIIDCQVHYSLTTRGCFPSLRVLDLLLHNAEEEDQIKALLKPACIPRLRHLGLTIPLIPVVTAAHQPEEWQALQSLQLRTDFNAFPDPWHLKFPSLPPSWRHIPHLLSLEFFDLDTFKETIEGHMFETAHFRFTSWPVLQPWQARSASEIDETFKNVMSCVKELAAYTGTPSSGRTTEEDLVYDAEAMLPPEGGPSPQELVNSARDEMLQSIADAGIVARWFSFSCQMQDCHLDMRTPEEWEDYIEASRR
ncbi:hypothetical protein AAT19DRAFT_9824 [Rhodotorula toruloides]|uniref:Uncharacterized protein n=1 Tax=Rhodotorula toruloides TaxID=5286 RepID=A0A2T0A124_RHOTO|nr:hypothetical protein AAT19DRAFT_9824 [Rhodotorula toruloides]